jgi:hypothetical protein
LQSGLRLRLPRGRLRLLIGEGALRLPRTASSGRPDSRGAREVRQSERAAIAIGLFAFFLALMIWFG